MYKSLLPIAVSMAIYCSSSFAATVAVIDSGVDVDHEGLSSQIYHNELELDKKGGVDDDKNGYVDDINGWNYVGNNNVVLDAKWKSIYNQHIYNYYYLQYALYALERDVNIIDQDLLTWYQTVLFDQYGNMNPEISFFGDVYGGYAHGTHVAGIIARHHGNKILPIKLLPSMEPYDEMMTSEPSNPEEVKSAESEFGPSLDGEEDVLDRPLTKEEMNELRSQLANIAKEQADENKDMFKYIKDQGARVANGSYGTGFTNALQMVQAAVPGIYEDQANELARYFMKRLNGLSKVEFDKLETVLFVAASGNDGVNNDIYPDYPSGVDSENVISVGATWNDLEIADFSNFGKTSVDVMAPGVGIRSTAPGGYVYMNGTSQAAPQVSRIAGMVVDSNVELTTTEVKRILMETVDKKDYLKDKCISGGIVNSDRAVYAAMLTKEGLNLDEAIKVANSEIQDVVYEPVTKSLGGNDTGIKVDKKLTVTPRINPIKLNISLKK